MPTQTTPPCQLTELPNGQDGDEFMYTNCYDYCIAHCDWPQDGGKDIMRCWAAYYRAASWRGY